MSSFYSSQLANMDGVSLKLFLSLLPKVPLIARVSILHILRLLEQSKYVDLRTALIIAVVRSFLSPSSPRSITSTQKLLTRDPGVKGRIWISRYAVPVPPESGTQDVFGKLVKSLADLSSSKSELRLPDVVPVEAEWTGYRADATRDAKLPAISEKEKYIEMMKKCTSPATALYFHGGAYWLLDPASHRATTKKLAKLTGGRCYSVRYRLAPQNPFPAALLDALVSYLALLYPPPDAFHEAVQPQHIVFAGDSAGGNLSLALLQTVLELRRQQIKIVWFGTEREVPLPGGVAVASPWMDITHSSKSCEENAAFDFLPSTKELYRERPPCDIWPAKPPRSSLYVDDDFLCHPLVTLLFAQSWAGAPPLFLTTGWELLADEDKFTAAKFHADGIPVVFEEYEGMPHCFALIFKDLEGSKRFFHSWTDFIRDVTEHPGQVKSRFTAIKAKSLKEVALDPATLSPYTMEQIQERIRQRVAMKTIPGMNGTTKL